MWVLHVDMDQFIAAVELLRHPELAGLPVVVGGAGDPTQRSVVATASYAAREYGIRSGMPMRFAVRKCPHAVFLPADNPAYEKASAEITDVLRSFNVVVEVLGWDEWFLGFSGAADGAGAPGSGALDLAAASTGAAGRGADPDAVDGAGAPDIRALDLAAAGTGAAGRGADPDAVDPGAAGFDTAKPGAAGIGAPHPAAASSGAAQPAMADPDAVNPEQLAMRIQAAVLAETKLHCSIGIGDNTLRAKMATEFGKPAGTFRLTAENWPAVMFDRPTTALWGIGKKTARKLAELELHTVRELAAADPAVLAARFGPNTGPWLVALGRGEGRRTVIGTPWVARSHSRETTFQQNLTTWPEIQRETAALTQRVHQDVLADGREVGRVAVKVRFAPFFTSIKSMKLPSPTADPERLTAAVLAVLEKFDHDREVRLLGVRAEFVSS